ncbi:amidohydrolase family protein [Blastopirellula marina]|nr:amidohydrolase family protein [Blastopirellula marina]
MKYPWILSVVLTLLLSPFAAAETVTRHEEGLRNHPLAVFALTNAQVITQSGQEPKSMTILVRDNKIEALGAKVNVPPEALVIDLQGKYVYPGFIDSYAEVDFDDADKLPPTAYWNDMIRSDFQVSSAVKPETIAKDALRKQGFVAQLIAPRDGILRGNSAIYTLGEGDVHQNLLDESFSLVGELTLSRRRSFSAYPNSPMGAVALARQAFYDAIWYDEAHQAASRKPALPRPETNVTLAAMKPYVKGEAPVMIDTTDEQFVLRANDFANEFGLDLIVVGNGREYQLLDDVAAMKRTMIVPLAFPKAPAASSPEDADKTTLRDLMHWDHAPENLGRLADRGVEILLTTHRLESPSLFLKNLRVAVKRGLSEQDALAAMTIVPAKRLGIDDQLGSLKTGKLASFVVTSKPLFEDGAQVEETWVNGRRFQLAEELAESLVGDWKLQLQGVPESAEKTILLNLTGPKGWKGSLRPAETTPKFKDKVELKSIKFSDGRLTGEFAAEKFGAKGVATLSIVFEEDAELLQGALRWPDGSLSPIQMTASGMDIEKEKAEATDEKPAEKAGEDKAKEDESKPQPTAPMASYPVQYPLGAYGRESAPEQRKLVALKGATVWTCGPEGKLENAIILIESGKIKAVGTDLKIPDKATVIDVTGTHISPGLIDCHAHIASDGGINESGQAVTAEVRIADFIDANDIDIYWQLAGGLTSSNILHGSANPIGGQNQVIKLRWGSKYEDLKFKNAPAGVKFALGENVTKSNSSGPVNTYPRTRMGVEQIFLDEFREAQAYRDAQKRYAEKPQGLPPRKDLELEAIAEVLEGDRWIHCHSYRQDEILALLRVLDLFEIKIGSLQHVLEGYKVADAMQQHGATGSTFSDWWAYKIETKDAIPFNGAIMHDQGIVVSFNSDDSELGRRMNQEAAKATKYGNVPAEEALKFVTLNPAKQLRIDQYVGSIEPGKDADLAVWSGPPLSNLSVCQQTWIDGRKYFDRHEEDARQLKFAEMKNALIQKTLDADAARMKPGEKTVDPSSIWARYDEFCRCQQAK